MRYFLKWKRSAGGRLREHARSGPQVEVLEDRIVLTKLLSGFREQPVASGLNEPTAMEVAPDGRIFVAEQSGALRVIKNGTLLSQPFVTIPVDSIAERGLLGVAFDPNFATNNYVYVYYTNVDNQFTSHNRVSRFTANGDVAAPASEQVIFDLPPLSSPFHNGGAIHFGSDGKLFVAVGDNGDAMSAQSLDSLFGKLLRINADGSIPTDNPFAGQPSGNARAVWALGLRNPFTFAVDPSGGRIFINDVGQNSFEEINRGVAGDNYGWPDAEGHSNAPQFTNPLFAYSHSGSPRKSGCAITGGTFYSPENMSFPKKYEGDYFFADLCNRWIRTYDESKDRARNFARSTPAGLVDLKIDLDGSLLYLARGSGSDTGVVNRISHGSARGAVRTLASGVLLSRFDSRISDSPAGSKIAAAEIDAYLEAAGSSPVRDVESHPAAHVAVQSFGMTESFSRPPEELGSEFGRFELLV